MIRMIYFILRYPAVFIGFWRDSNKYLRDHKLKFILLLLLFCSCGYGQYPHPLTYKHTTKADSVRYYHKLVEFRDKLHNCRSESDFMRYSDSCTKYWNLINPSKPRYGVEDTAYCCFLITDSDSSGYFISLSSDTSFRGGSLNLGSLDIDNPTITFQVQDSNENSIELIYGSDTTLHIHGDTLKAIEEVFKQNEELSNQLKQSQHEADWWKKAAQALEKVMEDLPADKPKPTPF